MGSLSTKIGTVAQLMHIAGIENPKTESASAWTNAVISEAEVREYRKYFVRADVNMDGRIDGNEARQFFMKSGLSKQDLSTIWRAMNERDSGALSEAQFYGFFQIVKLTMKGSGQLTKDFKVPQGLKEQSVLRVMERATASEMDGLGLLMLDHVDKSASGADVNANSLQLSPTTSVGASGTLSSYVTNKITTPDLRGRS